MDRLHVQDSAVGISEWLAADAWLRAEARGEYREVRRYTPPPTRLPFCYREPGLWLPLSLAIAFDDSGAISGTDVNTITVTDLTIAAGADRFLICQVSWSNTARTVTGITWNSVALSLIKSSIGGNTNTELWGLVAPATGNQSLVITLSGSSTKLIGAGCSYTGVNQLTPTGTAVSNNGTSSPATVDLTLAAGELGVDGACTGFTALPTVGAGQTSRANNMDVISVSMSEEAGTGATTFSWSQASMAEWRTNAVPLKPAHLAWFPLIHSGRGSATMVPSGMMH